MNYDRLDTDHPDLRLRGDRLNMLDIIFALGAEDPVSVLYDGWELDEEQIYQALHYYLYEDSRNIDSIPDETVREWLDRLDT